MKCRNVLRAVALLSFVGAFASCVYEDAGTGEIVLIPSATVFESESEISVTVRCPYLWTAALSDDSWCSIDRITGSGDDVITLSLKQTNDPAARSVVLTVASIADPGQRASILIGKTALEILLSTQGVDLSEQSPQAGVAVTHSGGWRAALSDESWCRIDRAAGSGAAEITVMLTSPADSIPKTTLLTVTSVDHPSLSTAIPIAFYPPAHGRLSILNEATQGAGIDIVILGDGFTSGDFGPGGKWETTLERCREALFHLEPFRSFREYFNLYAISAVSASDRIGVGEAGDTFFGTYYSGDRYIRMNERQKAWAFAAKHAPIAENSVAAENLAMSVIVNDTRYGGIAYFEENRGIGISSLHPLYFEYELIHETLGHAFGKLADEYVEFGDSIPGASAQGYVDQKERWGYYQNVEYTDRPQEFANSRWRELYVGGYPGVGLFEGGHTYEFGVWRSSESSIMNGRTGEFNAVSREILLRRIYRLAGREDRYTIDVFREYDRINTAPSTRRAGESIDLPPAGYPPI